MNRAGIMLSAALMLAGCNNNGGMKAMNNPLKKTAAAAPSGKADYFEVRRDGRTYVLGSTESLRAFNAGQLPSSVVTQTSLDPKGKPVVFERVTYTEYNRLVAEYKKGHGI